MLTAALANKRDNLPDVPLPVDPALDKFIMERREQRAKALAEQEAQPTLFTDLKRIVGRALRLPKRIGNRSGCPTTSIARGRFGDQLLEKFQEILKATTDHTVPRMKLTEANTNYTSSHERFHEIGED